MLAPNLYSLARVSPQEDASSLAVLLSARDAELANQGIAETEPARRELATAYAVLTQPAQRALYDAAVVEGRELDWEQLEYLGNFGAWPEFRMSPPSRPAEFVPDADPADPVFGKPTGVADYDRMRSRPTASSRVAAAFVDGLLISPVWALLVWFLEVTIPPESIWPDPALKAIVSAPVIFLYYVLSERLFGGTIVKQLMGWEVRDVRTGARPTLLQAAQRNWFRLVPVLAVAGAVYDWLGGVITIVYVMLTLYYALSISSENALRGGHDRYAGLEVARRR